MITQMGIPSRIAALQADVTNTLVPDRKTAPWKASALPTAGPSALLSGGAALSVSGGASTSLGSSTALTTVIDITGSGSIDVCALQRGNTTSATLRIKITADGVALQDFTSAASASNFYHLAAIGDSNCSTTPPTVIYGGDPLYFRTSLKVEMQQSANAGATAYYRYRLAAPYVP